MWVIAGIFAASILAGPLFGVATLTTLFGTSMTLLEGTVGIGAFTYNTLGASLSMTANSINPNAYLHAETIEDGLTSYLGDFFNESSQTNAALTAKIFGGTPKKDVDIMEFLSGMDPSYKEVKPSKDYEPIMHLYVIRANLTSNTQGDIFAKEYQTIQWLVS
ncbi:hypothetical protein MGN70_013132 [Eutypa lata]|nr:hypothetical protein MGN70_013132 [Eutypa lata]